VFATCCSTSFHYTQVFEPYLGIANPYPTRAYSPLWSCPANPSALTTIPSGAYHNDARLSYIVNASMAAQPTPKVSQVVNPHKKVLYAEFDMSLGATMISYYFITQPPSLGQGRGFIGHNGGMNVLFADYHVEWMPGTKGPIGPYYPGIAQDYWAWSTP